MSDNSESVEDGNGGGGGLLMSIPFAPSGMMAMIGWDTAKVKVSNSKRRRVTKRDATLKQAGGEADSCSSSSVASSNSEDDDADEWDDNNIDGGKDTKKVTEPEAAIAISSPSSRSPKAKKLKFSSPATMHMDMVAPGVRIVTKDSSSLENVQDNTKSTLPSPRTSSSPRPRHLSSHDLHMRGIVHLRFENPHAQVVITGVFQLTVLKGTIEVMGYRMTPESGSIRVNSSNVLSALVIRNCYCGHGHELASESTTSEDEDGSVSHDGTSDASCISVFELRREASSTDVTSERRSVLEYMIDPSLKKGAMEIRVSQRWHDAMDSVIDANSAAAAHATEVGGAMAAARGEEESVVDVENANALKSQGQENANSSKLKQPPRLLICGAKGAGKSTFLRYAVNRCLSSSISTSDSKNANSIGQVAILDCDVGQPEMSVPGILSLTIVTSPLLSPPHTHMVHGVAALADHHEAAYYYGHLSSKENPQSFFQMVSELMQTYQELAFAASSKSGSLLPLIVNTDGWASSMGKDVLSTLIDIVQPSHIVQLKSGGVNMSYDTAATVIMLDSFASTYVNPLERGMNETFGSFDLHRQRKVQMKQHGDVLSSLLPKDLRCLRLGSYFLDTTGTSDSEQEQTLTQTTTTTQDLLNDPKRMLKSHDVANLLAAQVPYRVPFDAFEYVTPNEYELDAFDEDMVFECLNASLVGLCCQISDNGSGSGLNPCIGMGLVRAVDRTSRMLYICTPLSTDQLSSVTTITIGHIAIPSLLCVGSKVEAYPYTSNGMDDTILGHESMASNQ
jgi:polynucleotide 5'-hydroxyl-kinase GRC3/NOL9